MWKNIPIILLIVAVVAVIGISDVSCASFNSKDNGDKMTENDNPDMTNSFGEISQSAKETAKDIVPNRITDLFTRLTKKQLIAISLVGTAVVILSSFAAHRATNSPAKYDIEEEAEKVSLALGRSSGSTQERLDEITKALCTRLSDSSDDPPLNNSTLTVTTENPTTENPTTENPITENPIIDNPTTGVDNIIAEEIDVKTTEDMPPAILTTDHPDVICLPATEKIFTNIQKTVGKMRDGFVVFDSFSNNDETQIRDEIAKTAGTNCGNDYFQIGERGGHEGVLFSLSKNTYINKELRNFMCRAATKKILPVLYEMGRDSHSPNVNIATTVVFQSNEMKATFVEGEIYAKKNLCGNGFFEFTTVRGVKKIKYDNSNTYIYNGWAKAINDHKCQKRADGVIVLLKVQGHGRGVRVVTKTARDDRFDVPALKAAYGLANGCDCGDGALSMRTSGRNVVFSYHNTNPYVTKAWKRGVEGVACLKAGKNIAAQLFRMGLYSTEDYVSVTVPEWHNNKIYLRREFFPVMQYDCQKGFFEMNESNGNFVLTYERNNPYIKREFETLTTHQKCQTIANGIYSVVSGLDYYVRYIENTKVMLMNQATQGFLKKNIDYSKELNCGRNFFTAEYKPTYSVVYFHCDNRYISSLCPAGVPRYHS